MLNARTRPNRPTRKPCGIPHFQDLNLDERAKKSVCGRMMACRTSRSCTHEESCKKEIYVFVASLADIRSTYVLNSSKFNSFKRAKYEGSLGQGLRINSLRAALGGISFRISHKSESHESFLLFCTTFSSVFDQL